jgi:hypothetical protein
VYEGRGAGDTPLVGFVVLKSGSAPDAAANAVLRGFQKLELSLGRCLGNNLRPRENAKCETDIAPLQSAVVNAYHAAISDPQYTLPIDRLFGVKFSFNYQLQPAALVVNSSAKLYMRGAGSQSWSEYRRPYSARFFSELITSSIGEQFRSMSVAPQK